MIETIFNASKTDRQLAVVVDEAREYAQIYLLAKQKQKGCQGTGELMTLEKELKGTVDKMIQHCMEKNHLSGACAYDSGSAADAFMRLNKP